MVAISKRPWSLRPAQRLLIAVVAAVYLVAFRPWASSDPSVAATVYAGAAAMVALAAMSRRWRLIVALAIAVVVAFAILFVGRAVLGAHA